MPKKSNTTSGSKGVIYARFSSHNQREESIEQQVAECKAFAALSGISVVGVYSDSAKTGRTDRRPQFQKLQREAAKGEFDYIIAYKSNRIARNILNALMFENEMEKFGIKVVYAKEEFGNNAAGRFALRTMMNVNQFFSENMAEDIKRNQADNALNCRANGPAPYGYKTGEDGKFAIDESTASVVREIYNRIANGEKFVEIGEDLNRRGIKTKNGNEWGKSSFFTILHNERYTGVYIFNDVRIEGGMPIIIERGLFDKVQKMLKSKKNPQGRKREDDGIYLLTGKLFCGKCKSHMIGMSGTSKSGNSHYYYICNEKRSKGNCDKKAVRRDYIESEVARAIREYILQPSVMEWIVSQVLDYQNSNEKQIEISNLQERQREVKKSIANVMLAIDQGIITASTKEHLQELESEKAQLEARILVAQGEAGKAVTRESLLAYLDHFKAANIENKDCQKELFDAFVKAVYLYDDHIKLTFDINDGETEDVKIMMEEVEEMVLQESSSKLSCGSPKKTTVKTVVFFYNVLLSKAIGISSDNKYIFSLSLSFRTILKSRGQNSSITCLHTPQGAQNPLSSPIFPPTTAIASNSLSPSLIALKNAVLSAQFVGEKLAFSTLHPVYKLPLFVRRAAPTLKFEYGA